jgi:hypothetical protein
MNTLMRVAVEGHDDQYLEKMWLAGPFHEGKLVTFHQLGKRDLVVSKWEPRPGQKPEAIAIFRVDQATFDQLRAVTSNAWNLVEN